MTQLTLIESALQRAAAVSSLLQGEVLGVADACVVLAEASAPLSSEAADIAASEDIRSGLIVVPHAVDDVVLLTQTCDLQFTTAAEHRCLVAPVIHVSERFAYEAWRGRRPGFAGLPWVGLTAVADLSRITTVERSVLVTAVSRGRPHTLRERLHFAETVGRYLQRDLQVARIPSTRCLRLSSGASPKSMTANPRKAGARTRFRNCGSRLRRTLTTKSRRSTYS